MKNQKNLENFSILIENWRNLGYIIGLFGGNDDEK